MRNVRQKISVMPSGNKFMFNVYLSTVDMKDVGLDISQKLKHAELIARK